MIRSYTVYEVELEVQVRKHDVDIKNLQKVLRGCKK